MRQAPKRSEEEGRLCVVREEREHEHIWKPCVTCQPRRSISCCRQARGQFFNELEIGTRVGRGAANTILCLSGFAQQSECTCSVWSSTLVYALFSQHAGATPQWWSCPASQPPFLLLQSFCPTLWLEMLRQAGFNSPDLQIERDVERKQGEVESS